MVEVKSKAFPRKGNGKGPPIFLKYRSYLYNCSNHTVNKITKTLTRSNAIISEYAAVGNELVECRPCTSFLSQWVQSNIKAATHQCGDYPIKIENSIVLLDLRIILPRLT